MLAYTSVYVNVVAWSLLEDYCWPIYDERRLLWIKF